MEALKSQPDSLNHDHPSSNPEKFEEFNYEILNSPELRIEYLTYTDDLIRKLVSKQSEVAIFLDKSARPVAWLVKELWNDLAPKDEHGKTPKMPEIKFLNIDREQWGAVLGRSEDEGGFDLSRMPVERINELRELYAPLSKSEISNGRSLLSDKKVAVIDEVRVSGDTLSMAKGILKMAFPDANSVESEYWMDGRVVTDPKTGIRKNTKLPIWYSDKLITGRLVGNRDTTKSSQSGSARIRAGRYFLSAPFKGFRDELGLSLKKDIRLLGRELRDGQLLYKPASGWDEDELESRLKRIDGLTIDQYIELIRTSPNNISDQNELYRAKRQRDNAKSIGFLAVKKD